LHQLIWHFVLRQTPRLIFEIKHDSMASILRRRARSAIFFYALHPPNCMYAEASWWQTLTDCLMADVQIFASSLACRTSSCPTV
jgi:hypothetical protein